jgi:hypothetical protein
MYRSEFGSGRRRTRDGVWVDVLWLGDVRIISEEGGQHQELRT